MSPELLQNLGLNETEAKLYDLLLKFGEISISKLISESHIKRPTVYKAVYSMEKKGLVSTSDIHKKIHVKPESPVKLQEIADIKNKEVEFAKKSLDALMPSLALSYVNSTQRPVVRTYEGVDGLKDLYGELLSEKKNIKAIVQAGTVEPQLYEWLTTTFVKKRVKAKIHVKAIVASSLASKKYVEKSKEEYRTSKTVDSKQFPFQHEIDVYGDKVAIINYKKDEPLIGILISNPQIAKTFSAWFDLAWGIK